MRFPPKLLLPLPLLVLLYFGGLSAVGMLTPDEPRYASIGRDMARSGDWITPRLWGSPWFEKPALLYWMIACGNLVGLDPELAPRVPVALISIWFLVFYFIRMKREFGERAAWFSTAILGTSAGWLVFSHVAVTDIPLAVTFSASMLLSFPWIRSGGRRGLAVAGILLGMAILAKGLVPIVLAAPLLWVGRRRWVDLFVLAAAALVTAAPWYVLCYLKNGYPFVESFFIRHHFARFTSPELQHLQPWWFYIPVAAAMLFPWTPALATLRGLDWREPRKLLLLSWILFGFVFFSLSANKLPGYILPLLPAATALIGIQLAAAPVRCVTGISAVLLTATPTIASVLPESVSVGIRRVAVIAPDWRITALIGAAAVVIFVVERHRFAWAFAGTSILTSVCVLWLMWTTLPSLDQVASARPVWRAARRSGDVICGAEFRRSILYGLNYYAGREIPPCSAGRNENHAILDRDRDQSR